MNKLNKAGITWPVKQVVRMYENEILRFDNARQRGEVWSKPQKSLFIDSIIRGMPVPPMYVIKTGETKTGSRGEAVSVYDCIDGKQRCTTVKQFKNNEFALSGLEPIVIGSEELNLNGLTYEQLPEDIKDDFDTTTFLFYYFENISDEDVTEMMNRLNNGKPMAGTVKARILSKDLPNIIKLGQHEIFSEYLTEKAILAYSNEDIVIKTYITLNDAEPSFENKRVQEIYHSHVFTEEEIAKITDVFDKTNEVISYVSNNDNKVYKKVIKKNNMLAVISYIATSDKDTFDIANRVLQFFTTDDNSILSQSEAFNGASMNATNRASNVMVRIQEIEKWCNACEADPSFIAPSSEEVSEEAPAD